MDTAHVPAFTPFRSGGTRLAYNEIAFRHFLAIERRRAQTSGRLLLLALVSPRRSILRGGHFSSHEAAAVFTALGAASRDVDLVGWLRESRVAAVLMAQPLKPVDDVRRVVTDRLERTLRDHVALVPLRVRVTALRAHADARSTRASGFD